MIIKVLDSLVIYTSVFFVILLFMPFFLVVMAMSFVSRVSSLWVARGLYCFFKAILIAGRIKIEKEGFEESCQRPVIFVANHQSSLDIPLIATALGPVSLLWLARSELENFFFLKIALRVCAIIADVNDPIRSAFSLKNLIRFLQKTAVHSVIFPEGSRYHDGKIHRFFNGFAFLADITNRPVVPILIQGASVVYPRGSFFIQREYSIRLRKGPAFFKMQNETLVDFSQRVRNWFLINNQL